MEQGEAGHGEGDGLILLFSHLSLTLALCHLVHFHLTLTLILIHNAPTILPIKHSCFPLAGVDILFRLVADDDIDNLRIFACVSEQRGGIEDVEYKFKQLLRILQQARGAALRQRSKRAPLGPHWHYLRLG